LFDILRWMVALGREPQASRRKSAAPVRLAKGRARPAIDRRHGSARDRSRWGSTGLLASHSQPALGYRR